jgi:hypothetical protein
MPDTGCFLALVEDAAAITYETCLCSAASEVGNGEEISAQVRDVQDILEDSVLKTFTCVHADKYLPVASSWYAAVVA